jgi:hypothetical protein
MPRENSVTAHMLLSEKREVLVVEDMLEDTRYVNLFNQDLGVEALLSAYSHTTSHVIPHLMTMLLSCKSWSFVLMIAC